MRHVHSLDAGLCGDRDRRDHAAGRAAHGEAAAGVDGFGGSRDGGDPGRTQLPGMLALTAVVVSGMAQIIFTNMVGLYAMTVWVCAGYIAAVQIHLRTYAKRPPRARRTVVDWSMPIRDDAPEALVGPSGETVVPGDAVHG
jgi:hypothetical protein